jgi:hypothetical protein
MDGFSVTLTFGHPKEHLVYLDERADAQYAGLEHEMDRRFPKWRGH